jgi:predicted amidohydrolase YtcJ
MRFSIVALATVLPGLALPALSPAADAPADLVLRNGKIVTLDDRQPVVQALAVRGDRILVVGSNDEIGKRIGDQTRVLDLAGQFAMPGFIEGHGHFVGLGHARMVLDLTRAKTWDDIVRQVEEAAKKVPAGEWILGRGWHQEKWSTRPEPNVEGYPVHTALSRVTPKNPVLLTHASGHMSFANAEAMRLAGVDARTANPSGGEILKDADGNPTGVFRETAQGLISRAQGRRQRSAEERARDLDNVIRLAQDECIAKGVTSFQDAGSDFGTIDVFRRWADEGKFKLRLWVMVRTSNEEMAKRLPAYRQIGTGSHHLTVRAIKRAVDGALGPHGAWLLEPYEDLPGSTGLNTTPIDSLRETARLAIQHDCQLCVHAIGDRANRETLNVFEEAFREHASPQSRRWRVEHAQHLHPDDIPRFGKLGVIASMQGIHCTSDAVYVLQRLGLRRASQGAYVWQSLIRSGATVSNGTDVPVEDVDPLACFYASVTRKLPSGTAFFPEQKMTREQALRSYTIGAAYAAFEEDLKGTLSPGKLADVVVLSQDILTVPDDKLRDTRVRTTIVGGKVVYSAP